MTLAKKVTWLENAEQHHWLELFNAQKCRNLLLLVYCLDTFSGRVVKHAMSVRYIQTSRAWIVHNPLK